MLEVPVVTPLLLVSRPVVAVAAAEIILTQLLVDLVVEEEDLIIIKIGLVVLLPKLTLTA